MAATPDVSFTKEKSNFLRLCRAIIDLGTEVLRLILNHSVPPNSILQEVKDKKLKLQPHQKQTLTTISDYKELDISFLYYLIRGLCKNIIPTRGWNPPYPPTPSEVTLGDDVERIHFIRNYIHAHSKEASLGDKVFHDHWEELESLMGRVDVLFGSNFKQSLLTVQIDIMDLETIKKGHLKDLKQEILDQWNKDDECFFETKASKKVAGVVKEKTLTVITGPPGSGKSAIAHHIATTLQNKDYQIVPVTSIENLEKSWIQGTKQAFFLDDVFGVNTLDGSEIENWYKRKERAKICFQNNKIIVTMKKQYSCDKRLKILFSEFQYSMVDITQKDLLLSEREKRSIFVKLMSVSGKLTNCNDTVKNCEFLFFPLLCKLFATDRESKFDLKSFFKNPLTVLKTEFELLRENKDVKYLCLVLCAIYDNELSENIFNIGEESKETKHIRKDFAECCGLLRSISRQDIKLTLDSLLGTYVVKEAGFYKFIHGIIYDVVVSTLTSQFQLSILKHCSSKFINERVVLSSVQSTKDEIQKFIVLDDSLKQKWMDRLILDIKKGNYLHVFLNICLKDETIEELFQNQLTLNCTLTKDDFLKITHRSDPQLEKNLTNVTQYDDFETIQRKVRSYLFYMCTINYSPLHLIVANNLNKTFKYVFDMLSRSEQESLLTDGKLIKVACLNGNHMVFELCMKKSPNVDYWGLLYVSITGGHAKIVQQLIEKIPKDAAKLLYLCGNACVLGYVEIVKILISHDADISDSNADGVTVLHKASHNGHDSIVQTLIDNGASVDTSDNNGVTALHLASVNGHDSTVQILIDNGASVDTCDNYANTALHLAIQSGHDSTVEILIENGANFDTCDNDSSTALHLASYEGHDSTVQILIDKGASVDTCDNNGAIALHLSSENGHDRTVQILINKNASVDTCNNDGVTALHLASQNGHDSTVQILIDNDASVDTSDNNGATALHRASYNGHDSVVQILIDNGANVDTSDNNGVTALQRASYNGHDSTVQILIDNGVSVDTGYDTGITALHLASLNGHDSTVQILIDKGASVDTSINQGVTSLHLASLNGHDSVVKTLIKYGSSINRCDNNNIAPLYFASLNGHFTTVQTLLQFGADAHDLGPLYVAYLQGHNNVVKILTDNGADLTKCILMKTALSIFQMLSK